MKKILIVFVLFTLILGASISANADSVEKLVPIHVNNHEMVDVLGNEGGLFPVYRKVEMSTTISNTIREILNLELTQKEKEMGFSTEWSEDHSVTLKGVSIGKGELTIELRDPHWFTSGGSARVVSLKNQIKETVLQFKEVDEVHFIGPEHLFQP